MPEDVSTPNASTIDAVAKLLEVEAHHTIKALVYECIKSEVSSVVVAFILGDDTLNEVKLKALTGADHLRPASESMLASAGLIKGFIGPQHLPEKLEVYLDDSIDDHGLYIAGANKVDFHTKNIQPSRDLAHIKKADLRLAKSGDLTLDGKGVVAVRRGIEVGHIFQLGDKYTKAMNVTVSDVNGKPLHPLMGCYGIGITRVAAAAVEQNNDEGGIIWPAAIAPYQVYLASIAKDDEVAKIAEGVYHELQNLGYEVLLDDRKVGPGFKFKDSDLLGLPVRVVVGDKTWKEHQKLELVWRHNGEKLLVSKEELAGVLKAGLKV